MSNMNLDQNTINNIKNMVDNGNISEAISQISPEMIQNFSKMLSSNETNNQKENTNSNNFSNNSCQNQNSRPNNNNNSFDFSNIDMNTILKMKSVFEKMNDKNDPRANLLYSLKPYLRDGRKDKLDQYVNLLNMSKIADVLKNDKKENNK